MDEQAAPSPRPTPPFHRARSLVAVGLVTAATAGWANIRELAISDGAIDQQRIQSTLLNNGSMVFVWEDQSGGDSEVKFRIFTPSTGQFSLIRTVNFDAAGDQVDPVVAPLANGGFAVAFASRPVAGDYDVKFRRFDFTGGAIDAGDLPVNVTTTGAQQHPSIARLDNGNLVIAFSGPGNSGQDLFHRQFDTGGSPVGAVDLSLNALGRDAVASGDQGAVKVGAFAEGGWMAVFEDRSTGELFGIRFNNAGVPFADPQGSAGDEYYFRLNEATANDQFAPALAAFGDEQFAVAFNSDTDGTAAGRRVRLRIFGSGGPATADLLLGSATARSQDPHVALISSTQLAVAWKTLETVGPSQIWSVYAQVFDLNGVAQGAPLFLHANQSLDRGRPHVIPWGTSGGFAVSWETGSAGGSIAARTVAPLNAAGGTLGMALIGSPGAQIRRVTYLGLAGECYQLEAAEVLNNWGTILTTNAPTGNFQFDDPDGATTPYRFFRVKRTLSGLTP